MLFDLSSTRRRRTTVKIIYGTLAILMVIGLVLLGVGTGSGGLLNSGNNSGGTGSAAANGTAKAEIKAAEKQIKANPASGAGYANLEQAYLSDATSATNFNETSDEFTKGGIADLKQVVKAWTSYAAVLKGKPNENAVVLAADAMDSSGDYEPAIVVWQDFISLEPSATKGYECLAANAYASKKTALGLQAFDKVISLTPKISQTTTKEQLASIKTASTAKTFAAEECGA